MAGTRKVKPIWIFLNQETVSGSGISWAMCKSAPCSRQTTTPAPHHSVFTGRMPFLPPNQQRQSTEGTLLLLRLILILILLLQQQQQQPFYGHYIGQPALAGTPVKKWRILLVQSFTARMPLLMATSIFGLGRRRCCSPQQCYLHSICTFTIRLKCTIIPL